MNKKLGTTAIYPPIGKGVKQTFTNTFLLSMPLLVGMWSSQVHAVPVTAPVGGEIEEITINDINDHWSGGVIVAGGQNIIVPKNLLIDLPANRVTLQQLFTEASASCQTQTETGLAKGDKCNASGTGGIATIQATRIDNGHVIAGDIFIEKGAETVTGQITFIDYTDGYFRVNGKAGADTGGVMVRLNDPDSRHTLQQGLGCKTGSPNCSPDPRFTLDGDNYTNVFSTGYPMCIPSTQPRSFADTLGLGVTTTQADASGNGDVLCPITNRTVNNGQPVDDSRRFAPIRVGDSIMAEGNYEEVNGVQFLSAHSSAVSTALSTKTTVGQPDYMFLDEVEVDAPGFQNQRARSLIIGYATVAPTDIMIWTIHYDPKTNSPHEFPFASSLGCDAAGGAGTCSAQGLVGAGANIFKIRHDVDFAIATKPRLNPCAHLQADPRFAPLAPCSANGGTIAEQFAILSPIPHEIQARTGRKFADLQLGSPQLITVDINGNEATNGQYLFPFGMGLGGISTPEMNEINLDAMATPLSFSGIPWNIDRRLGPGGCLDNNDDGIGECEATAQPLSPFPFEGTNMDPRTLGSIPSATYNDPNYVSGSLGDVRDRILSYVNPDAPRPGGNAIGVNDTGNFTTAVLNWTSHSATNALPPSIGPGSGDVSSSHTIPQAQICSANSAFNTSPVAKADTDTTPAGVAKTISVLGNDSDVNGDTLTVVGVSSSANANVGISTSTSQGGIAELNIDGTITFTPAANFAGVDTFSYTVSDGTVSVTGTVTMTMTVVTTSNNPPVASDDSATVLEDGSVVIDLLANDTDDNSGTGSSVLSIASVTNPASGTVTISGDAGINKDQKVTYTPNNNFDGSDTFSYVVADGQGGTATGFVTVNVTAVNDAPVATGDTANVTQGLTMTVNVLDNDTDIDSANLTVSLTNQAVLPTKGTVATNGTTVNYASNGATGADTFSYTISDGLLTATATVTVNIIAPSQDALTFSAQPEFRIGKSEWRTAGTGNADGKTITLRLGTAANGAIVGTSPVTLGVWAIRPKPGINPGANTQVTAWSSGGGKVTSTLLIRN
jgi:Bacterial Ig domain